MIKKQLSRRHTTLGIIALFLPVLTIFPPWTAHGFAAAPCTIPGTETDCRALISSLPWQFNTTKQEDGRIRISYLRRQEVQQQAVRLNISLDITTHLDQESTARHFASLSRTADPDMGLSYGWDLIIINNKHLYHLHADCTLAEQHFHAMGQTLQQIITPPGSVRTRSLFCRCGGGCRRDDR